MKNILANITCALFIQFSDAQQTVLLNQSGYNFYLINPAATGLNSETVLNTYFRKQWAGISDSPQLSGFTLDGHTNNGRMGLGCGIFSEEAGIFSKKNLFVTYRYSFKISDNSKIALGISPGARIQQIDLSKIKAAQPEEFSEWPVKQAYTLPDVSAGILYMYKELSVGFSGFQLLNTRFRYGNSFYNSSIQQRLVPAYQFLAKYSFGLQDKIYKITPVLIVRGIQGLPVQFDLSGTVTWREKLFAGIGYRLPDNVYLTVGYRVADNLRATYSYEHNFNGISRIGAHEFGLKFNFPSRLNSGDDAIPGKNKKLDDIYEKIDLNDQRIEKTEQKLDTIDRNLEHLKKEVEKVKKEEVTREELKKLLKDIKRDPDKEQKEKYVSIQIDSPGKIKGLKDTPDAIYNVIIGVFKNFDYAKSYQKILERQFLFQTKLIQTDEGSGVFYISLPEDQKNISDATEAYLKIKSFIAKQSVQVITGEPWILQTNK